MKKIGSLALIVCVLLSGCATNSSKDLSFFEHEQVIGDKIHAQILSTFQVYDEPYLVSYTRELGESITIHAKRQLPYRFTILASEKIYATSSPGGYVYVTTGMINYLDNEAELAAVLAHEIAQLQARTLQITRGKKILRVLLHGTALAAPFFGPIGAVAIAGVMATDVLMKGAVPNPDKKMFIADKKAMQYMVEAGYDPQSYLDVMKKCFHATERLKPYFQDYYQSRPMTEERMAKALKQFNGLDLVGKQLSTNYQTYQEVTKGVREIMYRV